MFPAEYDSSPKEVRNFAALQVVITAVFVLILYLALGGVDAPRPAWWVLVMLFLPTVIAGVLAERVWMSAPALDPTDPPQEQQRRGVAIFAAHTVRRLAICQAPVIVSILVTFVAPWAAWPLVVGAVPAIALLAFETTPGLRNTALTEVLLDSDGAESHLVEAFREPRR